MEQEKIPNNPFLGMLMGADFQPDSPIGLGIADPSKTDDDEDNQEYLTQARLIFKNKAFESEIMLALQEAFWGMTKDTWDIAYAKAESINGLYKRFRDMAERADSNEYQNNVEKNKITAPDPFEQPPILSKGEIIE